MRIAPLCSRCLPPTFPGTPVKHCHLLLVAAGLISASCTGAHPPALEADPGGSLAITHVSVIDVSAPNDAAALLPDQTVLIQNGRITTVGTASSVRVPRNAQVVDGRGKYLIPGLWDAHTHVSYAGESAFPVYVANGVTTLRDLGGRLPDLLALRQRVDAGELVGPDMYVAGPVVEGAWWLDFVVKMADSDSVLRSFRFLETSPRVRIGSPQDAQLVVDSLRRLGVDMIKFRNLRGDELRALASAARRHEIPVVGHAASGIPIS